MRITKNELPSGRKMNPSHVQSYETLLDYAHQLLGTPYPYAKDHAAVRKQINTFMEQYPETGTYQALTDVVRWAKHRKKHLSMVQLFGSWTFAYQDGFMKILERGDINDDSTLSAMLKNVDDQETRHRMIAALTSEVRNEIYEIYLAERQWDVGQVTEEDVEHHPLLEELGLYVGQVVQYRVSGSQPADLGTIIGEDGDNVIVYNGMNRAIPPGLLQTRKNGTWSKI